MDAAVEESNPCGPSVEYDPDMLELEWIMRSGGGLNSQSFGAEVQDSPVDWHRALEISRNILQRSKDLRVAMYMTRSMIHIDGYDGLRDGLRLIQDFVSRYWEHVHPQLDPDDENDLTARLNVLEALNSYSEVINPLLDTPIVTTRGYGSVSARDLRRRSSGIKGEGRDGGVVEGSRITAALESAGSEFLKNRLDTLEEIRTLVSEIEGSLFERTNEGKSFSPLSKVIDECLEAIRAVAGTKMNGGESGREGEPSKDGDVADGAGDRNSHVAVRIGTPKDVIRMLDLICEYYQRAEPSSPVPLLLKRARGLVSKSFMEIMLDLAPDGLSQIDLIRGRASDSDANHE
jgi:type VI secretion system protein ImpA